VLMSSFNPRSTCYVYNRCQSCEGGSAAGEFMVMRYES